MTGEKYFPTVLIVTAGLVLPLLVTGPGCRTGTGLRQSSDRARPPDEAVREGAVSPGAAPGPAGWSADRTLEPSGKASPAAPLAVPACSLWGRATPRVAYRRAMDEAAERYRKERNAVGKNSDPCGPRTVTEAKLRLTRAQEAARYTYQNAHLLHRLPPDNTPRFSIREIRISGNVQISSGDLLFGLPAVYVDARASRPRAPDPNLVYDFRTVCEIAAAPGPAREVSQRTIQGLTKYILSRYREAGFVGIYVYVSASAVDRQARLVDGILPLRVIEGKVAGVRTTWRGFDGKEKQEHVLREGYVTAHSPVQAGQVIRKEDLDQYLRLLNANPDRRVMAVTSPGTQPDAIDLSYDVYEQSPWHVFAQIDNSGTDRRQWNPRLGLLNTNLTGRDDRLSAMVQTDVRSPSDNYAAFGLYDFPLEPRLRLGVYAGVSRFDIAPEATGGLVSFLGDGWLTGLTWRYNVFQVWDWLFDFTGSVSREISQVDRSLGTDSDVDMLLAGLGFEVHRTRQKSDTSIFLERAQNFMGDPEDFQNARLDADPDFARWTWGGVHRQFVDANDLHEINARFRDILPTERLVPAKMTTFGGLYTVRGYSEDEIVADGGILASLEYRFHLSRFWGIDGAVPEDKKLDVSLVGFTDYGRPTIKDPMVGEFDAENLWGAGIGTILEVKPNFFAGIYYGWALEEVKSPSDGRILTDEGDGQWNFNFLYRYRF